MTTTEQDGEAVASAELYAAVQQFYARQMGALDDGAVDAWADTFTADALFEDAGVTESLRGREAIRDSVRARVAGIQAEHRTFRHWFGMIDVRPGADGSVRTRLYALAMSTPTGGTLTVHGNVVCADHLVPAGGGWLVRRRSVRADGV